MGFFSHSAPIATLADLPHSSRADNCQIKTNTPALDRLYQNIEVELDPKAPILWCWMNQPGKPIVTDDLLIDLKDMHRTVPEILDSVSGDPIKYYVFASRAQNTYSLGGDLAFFAESIRTHNRGAIHAYAHRCIDVLAQHVVSFNRPLITMALVQGDALGGGFETALSCDFIVAERQAKMGLPEILFNLFPGMGAYSFLSRRLSPADASRMISSGTVYTAEQLHEMGVVDMLANEGEGVYALREYVKENQRWHNAQVALRQTRRRVNPVTEAELRDVVDIWVDAV
ncbi:MAG TPA: crotonase/enoyl-CoA hydratase family protein, partial [Rhodopila sp.]|nr:crotonase/enoyl-CoA hydratase family protein [Rhodopila sp.]